VLKMLLNPDLLFNRRHGTVACEMVYSLIHLFIYLF